MLPPAAGAAGAVAAGKDAGCMTEFTSKVGLAFQIKDDILDVEGEETKMGKTLMKDISSEKSTFVTLLGLKMAKEELQKETDDAIAFCELMGEKGAFLKELAMWLLQREN